MGLINYTFYSEILQEQVNIAVVLPTYARRNSKASMDEFYRTDKKYKTLYVLHGGSDDCTYYYRNTGIERFAQDGGFAAVLPEVKNSFYCNMEHGQNYFEYLTKELPMVVQSVFPLSEKREDHYVVGNSMGSHGTMKWAMNYPEFFNAAAGMSGVGDVEEMNFFDVQGGPAVAIFNSFGTKETYRGSRNDLKFLAKKLADGEAYMPRFFSCCGTEDPYYKGTVLFKQFADEIGFPITYETGPGAHEWDFWDRWLRRIIDWMGIKDESK